MFLYMKGLKSSTSERPKWTNELNIEFIPSLNWLWLWQELGGSCAMIEGRRGPWLEPVTNLEVVALSDLLVGGPRYWQCTLSNISNIKIIAICTTAWYSQLICLEFFVKSHIWATLIAALLPVCKSSNIYGALCCQRVFISFSCFPVPEHLLSWFIVFIQKFIVKLIRA